MDWIPEISKDNMRVLMAWWVMAYFLLILSQWYSKRSAGLPMAYAFNLSMTHAIGAFSYCFDYYVPRSTILTDADTSMKFTFYGFYVAVIGFWSFVVGHLLAPFFFARKNIAKEMSWAPPQITSKLPGTLLLIGIGFFFFSPIFRRIPSFTAFSGGAINCTVLAVFLFCKQSFDRKSTVSFIKWLLSTALFPFTTMIFLGFAGYGINASGTTWQYILRFFKPRLIGFCAFLVLLYFGLSFYVNYMRERDAFRSAVWGQKSFSSRLDRMLDMFKSFEFYDPYKQHQLELVDVRLNQNDLVGKAIISLESNRVEYAKGGTLFAAAVAIVPRILWPGKPKTGGSGSVVARFTGMKFAEGTSVGVGQVMEFYINWGLPSVIICFIVLGMFATFVDIRCADYLNVGDYWNFTFWILPGMGMLQAGGIMSEIVGSIAGNLAFVLIVHQLLFAKFYAPVYRQGKIGVPSRPARGSRLQA